MKSLTRASVAGSGAAILFSVVALAFCVLSTDASAACGTPCFEQSDDILGVQTVAPADDLVVLSNLDQYTSHSYLWGFYETDKCDGSGTCQVDPLTTAPIQVHACGVGWYGSKNPKLFYRYPAAFQVGRMFDLKNDASITVTPLHTATGDPCSTIAGSPNFTMIVRPDITDPGGNGTYRYFEMQSARFVQLAKGDATRDGYDDVVVFTEKGIFAATATDPEDVSKGLTFGPTFAPSSGPWANYPVPVTEPSTGDLNNDGLLDVAWVGAHPKGVGTDADRLFIATVCPGPVANTICAGAQPLQIVLGSKQIALGHSSWEWCCNDALSEPLSRAVVGNFDTTGNRSGDELALFHQTNTHIAISMYSVLAGDETLSPLEAVSGVTTTYLNEPDTAALFGSAATLSFSSAPREDLIYSVQYSAYPNSGDYLALVAITWPDGLGKPPIITSTRAAYQGNGFQFPATWYGGHAAGRFAGIDDNTSNLDLQVALLSEPKMQIWRLAGSDTSRSFELVKTVNNPGVTYGWAAASSQTLDLSGVTMNMQGAPLIRAADMQGRSLRLGAPDVVRITSHAQPTVVINAPPSHVDYITPADGDGPEVFDISAVVGYSSGLSFTGTSSTNAEQQSTTSYTFSTKKTENGTVAFPSQTVNDSFGLSAGHKNAVTNTYANTQTYTNSLFDQKGLDISASSSYNDTIWYEENDFNVYNYPVIGVVGCPNSSTCADADKVPLYLTVSGPDNLSFKENFEAAKAEWYQPIHEVGNLLSYPQTPELAQTRLGAYATPLTSANAMDISWGNEVEKKVTWENSSGSGQTTGTVNTHSTDASTSFDGSVGTSSAGETVDQSKSTSWSTLNTSTTVLSESAGVKIVSPGTYKQPSDNYSYTITPVIFGNGKPDDAAQDIDLGSDVASYGPLTLDYSVDVSTISTVGSWWTGDNAYRKDFDLALNHPERWQITDGSADNVERPECLQLGSGSTALSCAVFNEPSTDETDPWMSDFLYMKGFFITKEADEGEGPLVSSITEGQGLFLETRVYNYSLKPLPDKSTTHVRFYAQEWCTTEACGGVNTPAPNKPSVLIKDVTLAQNPPAVDPTGFDENWLTASTVFDTAGKGGKSYVFWVVVYAVDSSNNLLGELPEHGLYQVPPDTVALDQTGWLGFTEDYGNNVGLFHWPVTVESAQTATAPQATSLSAIGASVTPLADGRHAIELRLRGLGGVHRGELMAIAARGPVGHRRGVDVERTPHLLAGEVGGIRIPFRAPTCGRYVLSLGSRRLAALASPFAFDVPCDVDVRALWLPNRDDRGKHLGQHLHPSASRGLVRIALLGSPEVPAQDIVLGTLRAGPGAAAPWQAFDRGGNLVLTFRSEDLELTPADDELCVVGSTVGAERFASCLDRP